MILNENGYRVISYEDILNNINNNIKSQIPNLSLDDSNPLIKINKKVADLFHQMSLLGLQIYSSFSIEEATGKALDDRVMWLGVLRLPEKKSSGKVEFTGVDGTFIPSNFRVATESNKIYYTLNNVTIASGKGVADVESLESGEDTRTGIHTVTKIVNPLSGVTSVDNKDVISGGTNIENDNELRQRYYRTLRGLGASTLDAMRGNILFQTTASKVDIIENIKDVTDSNGLPPHSFKCYVLGGEEDEVLQIIYENRPIGISPEGNIEKYFDSYVSRFSRPIPKALNFSIKLKLSQNAISHVEDIIKENIINAINLIEIGGKLDYTLFISALYKNTESSVVSFTDLNFWLQPDDKKGLGDFIQFNTGDFATILADNINIEVMS